MDDSTVTPEWTDHNAHDPGITILEVLAYSIACLAFVAACAVVVSRRCGVGRRTARAGFTIGPILAKIKAIARRLLDRRLDVMH